MKKRYLFLFAIFLFNVINVKAQDKEIEPVIKATYQSEMQFGKSFRINQTFVLLGNTKDYYFAGYKNYLKDTDQEEEKKYGSGITLSIADHFQERIIKKDGIISVFGVYREESLLYEENVNLKWVLYSETKIINGVKCQMAATNKFGRRWIAYFSTEHQIPIGPYKFTGLPGLIFEIYDTHDDYHFTLVKLEKYDDDFEFNLKGYKKLKKQDFLRAYYNLKFTPAGMPPMEGDMKREYDNVLEKLKKMHNNPLELKPFE
jgi:GLPGLI family protein